MVMVFTGNGKGKSTSAIGQAVRALGQGQRVCMTQFIKSDKFPAGEEAVIARLGENMVFWKGGLGFVGILGDSLPREDHRRAARETLERAQKTCGSSNFNLIILDEINVALHLGLVEISSVVKFVEKFRNTADIILTGRYASKEIIDLGDLVTQFEEIKHPFQEGVHAARGREY